MSAPIGITPTEIALAEENINLTLGIIRAAPEPVPLDLLVFPLLDRRHLSRSEHIQILSLTIGLLFLRLAEAEK